MRPTLLLIAALTLTQPLSAQELRLFSVGSGDLDGGYFAATRAICDAVNRSERGQLRCSPESTAGSLYNLVALDNAELDFALAQSDWQRHALEGTSVFASRGPMTRLRSVMSLYPEPFNLIARAEAKIGNFTDLIGKRVDIGQPASGRQATMHAVMESFGIRLSDFRFVAELPGSDAISELCAGRIDATVLIAGHPSAAIGRALSECNAEFVSLVGPKIDHLISASDDYSHFSIPAKTYEKLRGDVATFAVRATVLTLATMDDDVVDALVRDTLEHLEALRQKEPILAGLEVRTMRSSGLSAPLHPAAVRAFDAFLAKK
jgi:uncharacterized protein